MTQSLSPDAQFVLDATGTTGTPLEPIARGIATAVLRAASGLVRPSQADRDSSPEIHAQVCFNGMEFAANQLRAIATELGGAPVDSERPDTRRLRWLMHCCEGFAGVTKDRHDYAMELAAMSGRDEPNEMDGLNGFRLLIDAAMAAEAENGTDSSSTH